MKLFFYGFSLSLVFEMWSIALDADPSKGHFYLYPPLLAGCQPLPTLLSLSSDVLYVTLMVFMRIISIGNLLFGRKRRVIRWLMFLGYSLTRLHCGFGAPWNNHYWLNTCCLLLLALSVSPEVISPLRTLWGCVFFMAGISKLSEDFLFRCSFDTPGVVPNMMRNAFDDLEDYYWIAFPCMLAWGGFFIDFFGGIIILFSWCLPHFIVEIFRCVNTCFHLTNIYWLGRSIHYFPYQMLAANFTILLPYTGNKSQKNCPLSNRMKLAYLVIFVVFLISARRFCYYFSECIYNRQEWNFIFCCNGLSEGTLVTHDFSWRMKSRDFRNYVVRPDFSKLKMNFEIEKATKLVFFEFVGKTHHTESL